MEYVHHIPGRIRVRSPRLKNNAARANEVRTRLLLLPGIVSVETNPVTGSLTIRFDEQSLTSKALLAALQQHGFSLPPVLHRRPSLDSELRQKAIRKAAKAATLYLLKQAVEGSAIGFVAALL